MQYIQCSYNAYATPTLTTLIQCSHSAHTIHVIIHAHSLLMQRSYNVHVTLIQSALKQFIQSAGIQPMLIRPLTLTSRSVSPRYCNKCSCHDHTTPMQRSNNAIDHISFTQCFCKSMLIRPMALASRSASLHICNHC